MPRSCRPLLLRLLLAVALVAAQAGAQVHAYVHLAHDPAGAPATHHGCTTCLASAPLLSTAGGLQGPPPVPAVATDPPAPAADVASAQALHRHDFQARAPPALR